MSRRPAAITQADIARAIRAAKQTGASTVEVCVDNTSKIIIRIAPSTGAQDALEQTREIIL